MKRYFMLCMLLAVASCSWGLDAQQRARTRSGREVLLFDDGTWVYADRHRAPDDINVKEGGSGRSADILLDDDLLITLIDGKLNDFRVLSGGTRTYGEMNGELNRVGPYEIEYEFFNERIKRIGPYDIEYDFASERVKKIGSYPIEYDFSSGKISRIGNTRFKYSFFTGKLSEVSGRTPGVRITVF